MTSERDPLADALAAGIAPVRPPSRRRGAAMLAAAAALEAVAYVVVRGGMRGDMDMAVGRMALWWKVASLAVLAVIGVATTLAALDPAESPRRGLRRIAAIGAVAVAVGWALDAATRGGGDLAARLDPRQGIDCLGAVVVLSLPPLVLLAALLRRGAPTDGRGAATAAGLAAAAWGGTIFTVACPSDDPLYVVVWFAAAFGVVVGAARAVLPRLIRW